MGRFSFALICCVLLLAGVCLALPAEDLPETPCEQSDTQPFVASRDGSDAIELSGTATVKVTTRTARLWSPALSRIGALRTALLEGAGAAKSANGLALLCTLLC